MQSGIIGDQDLVKSNYQIRKEKAVEIITRIYMKSKKIVKFKGKRANAAIIIQKIFIAKKTRSESYIKALELYKYPWMYICREQKPFLLSLIKDLYEKYPQYGNYLEISKSCFHITEKY
jgi:hypothetical protein